MLRNLLIATSALISPALVQAADLPARTVAPAPVLAAAPMSWTGFYAGLHAGAAFSRVESTLSNANFGQVSDAVSMFSDNLTLQDSVVMFPENMRWFSNHQSAAIAGVQVGYNLQVAPTIVIGAELDWSWTGADGSARCGFMNQFACRFDTTWVASASGRIGFVFDQTMIYAKAGVAFADSSFSSRWENQVLLSRSDNQVGYLLGAGVEYKLNRNWSAKLEYNYLDFGTESYVLQNFAFCLSNCGRLSVDQKYHVVKIGLNYQFALGN